MQRLEKTKSAFSPPLWGGKKTQFIKRFGAETYQNRPPSRNKPEQTDRPAAHFPLPKSDWPAHRAGSPQNMAGLLTYTKTETALFWQNAFSGQGPNGWNEIPCFAADPCGIRRNHSNGYCAGFSPVFPFHPLVKKRPYSACYAIFRRTHPPRRL